MTGATRYPGEPRSTQTDWTRETLNAKRKAPAWHLVGEGRRTFQRSMAAQLRAGRVRAIDPAQWEIRYQPTDAPGRVTLYIRFTGKDHTP
jgi:hypothetical protein